MIVEGAAQALCDPRRARAGARGGGGGAAREARVNEEVRVVLWWVGELGVTDVASRGSLRSQV